MSAREPNENNSAYWQAITSGDADGLMGSEGYGNEFDTPTETETAKSPNSNALGKLGRVGYFHNIPRDNTKTEGET